MWQAQRESLPGEQGFKIKLFANERPFTFAEALAGWQDDQLFRDFILAELKAIPLPALFQRFSPSRRVRRAVGQRRPFTSLLARVQWGWPQLAQMWRSNVLSPGPAFGAFPRDFLWLIFTFAIQADAGS